MIGIAWRVLRRQTGLLVGAVIMTTVGAALLTAFVVLQDSVARAQAPVDRFAAAQVAAAGDDGIFTPDALAAVADIPGVAGVVPELSFPVQVLDDDGTPVVHQQDRATFGHAWTSARLTPIELTGPRRPGPARSSWTPSRRAPQASNPATTRRWTWAE